MCIEGDRRGIREVEKEEGSEMKVETIGRELMGRSQSSNLI